MADDEPKSVDDILYEPIVVVVAPPATPAPEDDYIEYANTSLTSSQASQSLLNSTLQGMWNQQALGQFQQALSQYQGLASSLAGINDWQAQKLVEDMLNDRGMIE